MCVGISVFLPLSPRSSFCNVSRLGCTDRTSVHLAKKGQGLIPALQANEKNDRIYPALVKPIGGRSETLHSGECACPRCLKPSRIRRQDSTFGTAPGPGLVAWQPLCVHE